MGSALGRVRGLRGGRKCCALEGGGGSGFAGDFGVLGWGMRVAEGMGMMDSLLTNPTMRMLEQTVNFTEQRHHVLAGDIANNDTPGYVQKDLSVEGFQAALRTAISRTNASPNERYEAASTDEVTFGEGSEVETQATDVPTSVVFHDRGVRSMEYLMSEMADNALAHNMAAQFLKQRYDQVSRAISMKV